MVDNEIILACMQEKTMSLASKKVGIPYSTFKRKAIQLNVWKPNQGGEGTKRPKKSLSDVFEGKVKMRSYQLKERLITEGYKQAICEKCKLGEEWNNDDIVLELDHIDGNKNNNHLENLRILCPNCHSQTQTFRGRRGREIRCVVIGKIS